MSGDGKYSAFEFEGTWREYAPIAFTNLLLTIVTLGIYRFWAKARKRQYLWSKTRFIDDRLEWAGTGGEMFKGALMALLVVVLPLFILNQVAQFLVLNGMPLLGGLVLMVTFVAIFYLVGVALFRSLRYRLSRTYWHGIRGGSADPGLKYGFAYLWMSVLAPFTIGLLTPWTMVQLWNRRWNAMSFGPYPFDAHGRVSGLMGRFLMCYLAPALGILVIALVAVFVGMGVPNGPARPIETAATMLFSSPSWCLASMSSSVLARWPSMPSFSARWWARCGCIHSNSASTRGPWHGSSCCWVIWR